MFKKFLALALGLSLSALSHAVKYELEASHTEVGFKVSHLMVSKVSGFFKAFSGTIDYNAKDITKSKVNVEIDTASIDTRNERRDGHLRSADFFEVEKYPKATFKSKKIAKGAAEGELEITGDLTLRGVTKPVTLKATVVGPAEGAMGEQRLGFSATATINRMDYGIAWNKTNKTGTAMAGAEVELHLNGEAVKK